MEEFEQLMESVLAMNDLQEKALEMQAFASKTEGWNVVLLKQSSD
jgi:hypothetical protein